jgi:integrase
LYLTLLMTGLRPGELPHLLLSDDLDLEEGWLHVRNKPRLGWQVKTRSERSIPLVPALLDVLRATIDGRSSGPVLRRRKYTDGDGSMLAAPSESHLQREIADRCRQREAELGRSLSRLEQERVSSGPVPAGRGSYARHLFDQMLHHHGLLSRSLACGTSPSTWT